MNLREKQPPKWMVRLFRWFCNDHLSEAVLGDLIELYQRRIQRMSHRKANLLFFWNVIQFLQPFAIRRRSRPRRSNPLDMLRNYLVIAWRVLIRQRMYSAVNMGGFALGIAICIIITLYIRNELRYDAWLPTDVYRVVAQYDIQGSRGIAFPAPFGNNVRDELPEAVAVGRFIPFNWFDAGSNLFRRDDQTDNIYEERFAYADPELVDMLDIPIVYGDGGNPLRKPQSILISKRIADKYFPDENPVGRIVILNDQDTIPYTIGGVMADIRDNTHLDVDFLITLTDVEFWPGEQTSWCCWNYVYYVKLQPGTDPVAFAEKMNIIRDKYFIAYLNENNEPGAENVRKHFRFHVQPVRDVYLKSADVLGNVAKGDIRYVRLLGGIALFILLLACVNFINLATARSANRAKEVGLRKVVGSIRGNLVRQFLTESVLFSVLAHGMALLVVVVLLPFFNRLIGLSLSIPWREAWFMPSLAGSAVLVGILAGAYPSFFLSSFQPIDVIKGRLSRGTRSAVLRGSLVVFQFAVSVVLLIGTFVVNRQMNFILNSKVGFDREQVIMIEGANTMTNQQEFKHELLSLSGVQHVTISSYLPTEGTRRDQNSFWVDGKQNEVESVGAQRWYVDEHYLDALGIKLLEGRNFDPKMASDSQAIIINQAMARELDLENPVGARIRNWIPYTVIGVIEDFHFESMKGRIRPLSLVYGTWGDIVCVKVNAVNMKAMLENITSVWDRFMPNQPIRYTFMDESYARMYADVERTGRIFTVFSVLAILVACLGLFALSAFLAEQRGKEMSIRLVLGAPIGNIFRLLTQNFILLVMIALAIGAPIGWYAMTWWLQDYEYRIDIGWDVFVMAGALALMIALLTVCYQSLKVATSRPAERLRSE